MALKFGSSDVSAMKLGSQAVSAVYLGADQADTGGGGGGAYVAKAFSRDANTWFTIDSLTAADSPYWTLVAFKRITAPYTGSFGPQPAEILDIDTPGDENAFHVNFDGSIDMHFDDDIGGNGTSFVTDAGVFPYDNNYHSFVASFDFSHPVGEKLMAVYMDRQPLVNTQGVDQAEATFVCAFNGKQIGVPDNTGNFPTTAPSDDSVFFFYPGLKIVQADNTILSSDLNNFVTADNKPVDPAVAVAAYGAPAILMTGDASDLTNHGNGGALVVTGTPTDTDAP